ncbi:MAG: CotS family spore coat protein [Lachnospiraceae bacterium]|nr:CotS family spore coat protein [Lachnospiraceae bacterium]
MKRREITVSLSVISVRNRMEGVVLYNQAEQCIEQYPFTVSQTSKGRGALICSTECGEKVLKEYKGSAARAEILYEVACFLKQQGIRTDVIIKTAEQSCLSGSEEDGFYLMKDWYSGRECDTKSREDILFAVRKLAELHACLKSYGGEIPEFLWVSEQALTEEFEKHTREIKKVRNYVRGKKKKNAFEEKFMETYEKFLVQAEEVLEGLKRQEKQKENAQWKEMYGLCHGDYNQHNIVFAKEGMAIINFEQMHYDIQVGDLAHFMRKILEKHNWNTGLGMDMITAYDAKKKLSKMECEQLYLRLSYPEKFWKIANHYYNSNKAWVSGRDIEKLEKIVIQEKARQQFLQMLFYFVK